MAQGNLNAPLTPARILDDAEQRLAVGIREAVIRFNNETGCTLTQITPIYNRYTQDMIRVDSAFTTRFEPDNDSDLVVEP